VSRFNIVRAWKDAEYRRSLSQAERALLPDHPAGAVELTDAELAAIAGGENTLENDCTDCCTMGQEWCPSRP
jgi:mersacidin/lichenicidin family type 2 lantibiotic